MKGIQKKMIVATVCGNLLDHYDKTLYIILAPFIAKLFYPHFHPITQLILAYLPVSFIFRPIGALFFGYLGDRIGRIQVLRTSIVGMSLMMIGVGLAPTYTQCGILSAFILHFFRGMICFFSAGEGTAAALTLIEGVTQKHKDLMSSFYEMSSLAGALLASFLVTSLLYQDLIILYWRWLFIISGVFGLILFCARQKSFLPIQRQKKLSKLSIKENLVPFFAIVFVTGFIGANYNILTALMNGLVPLISSMSRRQMMLTHSGLMIFDFILLPIGGLLAKKYGKEKMIGFGLLCAFGLLLPLFNLLNHPTMTHVFILRAVLISWGILLTAPYEHWMMSIVSKEKRFRIIALAKAMGMQWIGGPAISVSLWLFQETKWVPSLGIYTFFCALLALVGFGLLYGYNPKSLVFRYPKIANQSKH